MSVAAVTRPSLLLDLRDAENSQAWENFVQIYSKLIFGFCCQRGLQPADAADVTQEVLKSVARTIQRFEYDPSKGRFRSWLLTVTRNKLNNFLAAGQRRPESPAETAVLQLMEEKPSAEEESDWDRELQQRLFEWAAALVQKEVSPKTWSAFWATAVEDQSGDKAAETLGLTVGAVYVAKSRVIARLRELVASVGDGAPNFHGIIES